MPTKYSTHLLVILVISIFLISITAVNNAAAQDRDTNQSPYLSRTSFTRSVQENLAIGTNVGDPMEGIDPEGLTVTYSITHGVDSYAFFAIDYTTGQLSTRQVLDYEKKASHTIKVGVTDPGGNSNNYKVTINVINDTSDDNLTNSPPKFIEGDSTTRNIIAKDPNSAYLGSPVLATDADGGTLFYVITDDPSGIFYMGNPDTENPRKLKFETPQLKHGIPVEFQSVGDTYKVELTVWDDQNATDTIQVTINLVRKNSPPAFLEDSSATRSIEENTGASIDIGKPIYAIDAEERTITYSLGGTDASSFSINSETGQLQTAAPLDYETKNTYAVTVTVSDEKGGSDSINVTINVTDVNEPVTPPPVQQDNSQPPVQQNNPPVFSDGTSTTRSVAENTPSNRNIGSAVTATDPDGDTLTYSIGGTDAASFSIVNTFGQLRTAVSLDYEAKSIYTVTVTVSDGEGGSDSITVTINVTDVNDAPLFSEGAAATRSIPENTPSNRNIGNPASATDPDGDTLTYSIGGTDAASFSIVNTSGQLRTAASLDYEAKNVYTVTVTVSDGKGGSDSINVTIKVTDVNDAPLFSEGASATRSIPENTASGTDIGSPISASDADSGDTLTCTLSGTDAASFSLVKTSGQLRTATSLDYETKNAYTVTVTVSDGKGGSDSINVTINVTDVNEPVTPPPDQQDNSQPPSQTNPQPPVQQNNPPVFSDGTSTTRSVAENTPSNRNIGSAVTATDPEGETLIYSLSGADAAAFSINSNTGQLQTVASLDYETKNAYSVTITATDQKGLKTNIDVIINVTDVNETVAPPPIQQPQPQPETDPESEPQLKAEIEPTPEPEPEPNYTIFPFDYEKPGVGKVVFTEVMLARLNKYPQWIELYNTTNQDIDVKEWKIVGRYLDDSNTMNILESQVISKPLTIKGKETVLIVSYAIPNSRDRISTGLADKTYALGSNSKNFWNYEGIVLELQDTEGNPIDRIGNLNEKNEIVWGIPVVVRDKRISLIRRLKSIHTQKYDFTFGMKAFGWFPANESERLTSGRSEYYYGRWTDIGSPGYRTEDGEILPVTLSSFNPQRNQDGSVVISWITESEVDNAGFNIFRSEKPQGPFNKVNPKLVQGAGTTGERNEYVWTDNTAKPNVAYYYQIEDVSFAGVHQPLATKRVKDIFTAKNRQTTSWGNLKREFNFKYSRF